MLRSLPTQVLSSPKRPIYLKAVLFAPQPYFPVGLDLNGVDRTKSLLTCTEDKLAQTVEQSLSSLRAVFRLVQIVGHQLFLSYPAQQESHAQAAVESGCGLLLRAQY